ncbi:Coq4 family protein [Lacinutrix sp. Hel_I_90]|uniref:Coq4 family protein n=1 Tax=Lacinutrix sp. Hel_I_90 TaxID=1249999 RepID=UPI0009E2F81A|nr:Coq4 family protein [Lacinutrix sp. Hel_I_90]
MRRLRKKLITWLFEISKELYTYIFKSHAPWGIYKKELLTYPKGSFGKHLGLFLDENNFELIPKVERHDAYHVLTGYGTKVEDEIALQFLSFGNGKRSLYLYGAILLGTLILPDYIKYYLNSYHIGKTANSFHHLNFKKLLKVSLQDFRACLFLNHTISCYEQAKTIQETLKNNEILKTNI